MPVTLTYPGVYIEEVPSGVRTITGVATSITAFLGRAARGPVNDPTTVLNFGDFERMFGGLHADMPMTYAVRDFFLNGGSYAIIVRLYKAPPGENTTTKIIYEELEFSARHEGTWGNNLRIRVTHPDRNQLPQWAEDAGLKATDLFNLFVHDTGSRVTESHLNVTGSESRRRVDRVLASESVLVKLPDDFTTSAVPIAHEKNPAAGKTVWEDDNTSTGVLEANLAKPSASLTDSDDYEGSRNEKTGLYALEKADLFNLLCVPADQRGGDTPSTFYQSALAYCVERRAMLIVDPPAEWSNVIGWSSAKIIERLGPNKLGLTGTNARNAALYFPRVKNADPERDGQIDSFVPCGIIAGIMARTDEQRGVWKAPAGIDASLTAIRGLEVPLSNPENGLFNPLGVNCLRNFPVIGPVIWGARTLRGADQFADDYKYVPVRRLALYIEESLYRGTQWAVFEPNDEPLWSQLRLSIGAFMNNLFRQGAFQGKSPREAYFVKVDSETTTQNDINLGIVNIIVGFAPLKPAEFVVLKIQQIAGQVEA